MAECQFQRTLPRIPKKSKLKKRDKTVTEITKQRVSSEAETSAAECRVVRRSTRARRSLVFKRGGAARRFCKTRCVNIRHNGGHSTPTVKFQVTRDGALPIGEACSLESRLRALLETQLAARLGGVPLHFDRNVKRRMGQGCARRRDSPYRLPRSMQGLS